MNDDAAEFPVAFKVALALQVIGHGRSVEAVAAEHAVPPDLVARWQEAARLALAEGLRDGHAAEPMAWTPDLVARFWNNLARTDLLDLSFSRLAGNYLFQVIWPFLDASARHLDFGSGDGHLALLLTAKGYPTAVYEPSSERMATLNRAIAGVEGFLGVVGPGVEPFDAVLMIEVIEHIIDAEMPAAMAQVDALLKPDGLLIVTTPNAEPLQYGMCCDPVSGRVFHRWQHVRSFTKASLIAHFDSLGFEPVVVHTIEFSDRIFSAHGAGLNTDETLGQVFSAPRPVHLGDGNGLVYVGRRKGSARLGEWADAARAQLDTPLVVKATTSLSVVG